MTDLKFKILEHIYSASPTHEDKHVNILHLNPKDPAEIQSPLKELIAQGLVGSYNSGSIIRLTQLGISTFENAKEMREQNEANKRQQGYCNKLSKAALFISLVHLLWDAVKFVIDNRDAVFNFFADLF